MAEIRLDIDDDLAARIEEQPHVDWNRAVESALESHMETIDRFHEITDTHDVVIGEPEARERGGERVRVGFERKSDSS
jgi:hypothetical protein